MKLLSVNVAQPKTIIVNGTRVATAIFKVPVGGPVKVERLNLEGDRQADLSVHGGTHKAVYAYPWENTVFWQQSLKRPDLLPGAFGENLTVEGLLESDVAIGDELGIGDVRFQVTTPRIPCFKLAAAIGLPDFATIFLESGRTGFYLRVVREGVISPGDPIRKIESPGQPRMTIARLAWIRYKRRATPAEVQSLRAHEALPDSWKVWLAHKLPTRPERM